MNSTDLKLYELFAKDFGITDSYQNQCWVEPQLHDVFRVNREKYNGYMEVSDFRLRQTRGGMPLWQEVPYNPCLPLLQQSENEYNEEGNLVKMGTKEQIISLFS